MTDEQARRCAETLGISKDEFLRAYNAKLRAVEYDNFMRRSPEENVAAILDRLGVKLSPLHNR